MTLSSDTQRAWVDIDLTALLSNARTVAKVSGARLLPMVKANGYGLGAVEVARALEAVDPWGYGLASLEEAGSLRSAGITRPLLVVTPLLSEWIPRYLELDIRPSIGDPVALEAWVSQSRRPFHIEIDTGMSRTGFAGTITRRWRRSARRWGQARAGKASSLISSMRNPIRRPPRPSGRASSRRSSHCPGGRPLPTSPTAPRRCRELATRLIWSGPGSTSTVEPLELPRQGRSRLSEAESWPCEPCSRATA